VLQRGGLRAVLWNRYRLRNGHWYWYWNWHGNWNRHRHRDRLFMPLRGRDSGVIS